MFSIDEKRKQVLDFVNEISNEETNQKPEENSWSMLEVLEHLYLMEQLVVNQIKLAIEEGDQQQATEKPLYRTTNREYKVEAPESVQPKGKFQSLEEAENGLEKNREATLFLVNNKDSDLLQNRVVPHPSFGNMNLEQWVEFIGWHELRHLEQMKEIKKELNR